MAADTARHLEEAAHDIVRFAGPATPPPPPRYLPPGISRSLRQNGSH